jgi:hypothetical protein
LSDDDILEEARAAFQLAADVEAENRRDALDDLRFARLGEQWPEKVRRERELEGRPCLTINRLPTFIRQVVNDARQNKPAISVHPVDGGSDPETAEVFNGLIRHIEQSSDAEVAYDTALDFAVTSGVGYFRINTRYAADDGFDQDIAIERVANPFSIYGDPEGTAADSSDWNTAFVVDTLPRAVFEARWKGAQAVDWEADDYGRLDGPWLDGDRVMVAEYWRRERTTKTILALSDGQVVEEGVYKAQKAMFDALGVKPIGRPRQTASHKVTQRIVTGAEVLETVDWAGRFIPIVPVYGEELLVDGRRRLRSQVRDAKDPQRMFNYWRTTSTELVALAPKAPFIGRKGAFETDSAKWATANVQSHAYIEYDGPEPPMRQGFAGVPAGALQEAMNAADDMKSIMGLFDASLGARSNETSGRAIMARQREGACPWGSSLARTSRGPRRTRAPRRPRVSRSAAATARIRNDDAIRTSRGAGATPRRSRVALRGAARGDQDDGGLHASGYRGLEEPVLGHRRRFAGLGAGSAVERQRRAGRAVGSRRGGSTAGRCKGRDAVKRLIAVCMFLGLGACSSLSALTGGPGADSHQETLKALGEHISACDRHYQGGVGLGANFTFNIDCKAQPVPQD